MNFDETNNINSLSTEYSINLSDDIKIQNLTKNDNSDKQEFWDLVNDKKAKHFRRYLVEKYSNFDSNKMELYEVCDLILSNASLKEAFDNSEIATLNKNIKPKYNSDDVIIEILSKVNSNNDIVLNLSGVEFKFNGTTFKPRRHYTKTITLRNYFRSFTWISKMVIKLNKKENYQKYVDGLLMSLMLSKISEGMIDNVNDFESFIKKIIGEPDGYVLSSFLNETNNFVFSFDSVDSALEWMIDNKEQLASDIILNKKCKLAKYGDTIDSEAEFSFSLVGKGTMHDNIIIQNMVDNNFNDFTGKGLRKYSSIFDVTYALFGNEVALKLAENRMNNVEKINRDGFEYTEYLKQIKKETDEANIYGNTLYNQEIAVLRSLTKDKNYFPFNSEQWEMKQTQTQIGHYCEMRHDNVLYAEKVGGCTLLCEYPDLLVEPVPTFWKEFLNLIYMMKDLVKNDRGLNILQNFEDIVILFIEYLTAYSNGKQLDELSISVLKSVIIKQHGSGSSSMDGWYPSLFYTKDEAPTKFNPEVSSFFTAVPDERDDGGIIHLGNGPVQLMYVLTTNNITKEKTVYVGPVYSTYEFITDFNTRLNDEEWKNSYQKYKPLNFNLE